MSWSVGGFCLLVVKEVTEEVIEVYLGFLIYLRLLLLNDFYALTLCISAMDISPCTIFLIQSSMAFWIDT